MLAELALPGPLLLVIAALSVAAETALTIGLILPGASALIGLGLLAGLGVIELPVAVLSAGAAAVTGGQLGYRLGGRTRLPPSWDRCRRATAERLGRAGPSALLATQWVVGARTIAPRLAAEAGFGLRRFSVVQVPTALVWGATLVVAGAVLGEQAAETGPLLAAAVAGTWVLVYAVRSAVAATRRRAARDRPGTAARTREPAVEDVSARGAVQ